MLDLDGCVTSNPDFFKWWTYTLTKKGNNNEVWILTARNPSRIDETIEELAYWGIKYDQIFFMGKDMPRDDTTQARWKLQKVKEMKPDIWIDNDFKVYERVCDVRMKTPGTEKILI